MTNTQVRRALGMAWLDQPVLRWISLGFLLIGSGFYLEARASDEAFSADIFGDFALMFPAEMWALAMMIGSALTYAGLVDPQRRWLIMSGGILNAVQFTGLAYSAIMTGGELVVGLHASILFAPCYLWTAYEAYRDSE
jgi:hypothetical protein